MAATIREEVSSAIFVLVVERIVPAGVAGSDRMLVTAGGPGAKSDYNRLKRTAPRPSWTNYRLQIAGRPRRRRRPSRVTCCASVRQPVQLVCQGFGDGTDAAV